MLLKRLCELVISTTSSLIEPEAKIQKRNKRVPKLKASTHCLPFKFELVESTKDSCLTLTSKNLIQACP